MTEKEGPARRSFRLKVEHLEDLDKTGAAIAWLPKTVADLASWVDPARGFTSWVSFSIATLNGPNGDLRRRYDLVLGRLRRRAAPGSPQPRRGREVTHSQALREVKVLAEQNATLVARVVDLEADIIRSRQYVGMLERRERELIEQLNCLLPLDKRLRSRSAG